ncbi:MAG: SpoIIE family protein phosphatase, partial [Planctomycetota bacterium]
GDALVLYSDGITEASAADGQMFAEAGLARALARNHERSPANMAAAVLADMAEFRGSVRPADDLTLMVLRRTVPAVV